MHVDVGGSLSIRAVHVVLAQKGDTMRAGRVWHGLAVVGCALTLVYFGLFTGRSNLLFFGQNATEVFSLYAHAAEAGQVCCLAGFGFLAYTKPRLVEWLAPYGALMLLVGGYALTLWQALDGDAPDSMVMVAGAVFGAGQGASFMGWLLVYSRMELHDAVRDMVLATILSGLLLVAVGAMPSTVSLFSALSLIVAGCCAALFYCRGRLPEGRAVECRSSGRAWLRSWVFLGRRALLCLVAIAFVCGAQRVVSLEGFLAQGLTPILFAAGYALGALLFVPVQRLWEREGNYFGTYSVLLAVMATCGFLSSIQNEAVQTFLYLADNIAFTVVSICMVMTVLWASQNSPCSPLCLGGLVCGTVYFAIQLGRVVCNAVGLLTGMDMVGTLVVSVIIIYVVALAAISSGAFLRQVMRGSISHASIGGTAEVFGNATGPTSSENQRVISISSVTEDQLRANPVYRLRYGLTDREMDVLVLLLAGYNAADIAEMLSISANTVKTHLKGIYAKMDVHSRRELIALLNDVERG